MSCISRYSRDLLSSCSVIFVCRSLFTSLSFWDPRRVFRYYYSCNPAVENTCQSIVYFLLCSKLPTCFSLASREQSVVSSLTACWGSFICRRLRPQSSPCGSPSCERLLSAIWCLVGLGVPLTACVPGCAMHRVWGVPLCCVCSIQSGSFRGRSSPVRVDLNDTYCFSFFPEISALFHQIQRGLNLIE